MRALALTARLTRSDDEVGAVRRRLILIPILVLVRVLVLILILTRSDDEVGAVRRLARLGDGGE